MVSIVSHFTKYMDKAVDETKELAENSKHALSLEWAYKYYKFEQK